MFGKGLKKIFDSPLRHSVYRNSPKCRESRGVTVGKAMLSDYDEAAEVSDYMRLGPADWDVFPWRSVDPGRRMNIKTRSGKRLHNYGTWSIEIGNTHITMEHGAF